MYLLSTFLELPSEIKEEMFGAMPRDEDTRKGLHGEVGEVEAERGGRNGRTPARGPSPHRSTPVPTGTVGLVNTRFGWQNSSGAEIPFPNRSLEYALGGEGGRFARTSRAPAKGWRPSALPAEYNKYTWWKDANDCQYSFD